MPFTFRRCITRRGPRGFAIIELSAAAVVLSVVASVALMVFIGQRNGAQDAVARSSVATVMGQAHAHFMYNGRAALDGTTQELIEQLRALEPGVQIVAGESDSPYEVSFARKSDTTFALAARSRTGLCVVGRVDLDGSSVIGSKKEGPCSAESVDDIENGETATPGNGEAEGDNGSDEGVDPTTTTTTPTEEDSDANGTVEEGDGNGEGQQDEDEEPGDTSEDEDDEDDAPTTTQPDLGEGESQPTTTTTTIVPPEEPTTTTTTTIPAPDPEPDPEEDGAPQPKAYGGYALFAIGGTACGTNLAMDNNDRVIMGDVHTNGGLRSNGNAGNITGLTTYVGSLNAWPPNQFVGGIEQTSAKPAPVSWDIADYAPGGAKAAAAGSDYHHWKNGMSSSVDNIQPGLHYVQGNVNIWPGGSGNVHLDGVTIVATGTIQLSAANLRLSPYEGEDIVVFANSGGTANCWNQGVNMSTTNLDFRGVIYAPNGKIGLYTNQTASLEGALVGYTIQATGNKLHIEQPN